MLRRRYIPSKDPGPHAPPAGATGKAYPPKTGTASGEHSASSTRSASAYSIKEGAPRAQEEWVFVPDVQPSRGTRRRGGVGYYVGAGELVEIGPTTGRASEERS